MMIHRHSHPGGKISIKTIIIIYLKDFAAELTSHNVIEKDLKGDTSISKEHIDNNSAVRKLKTEREKLTKSTKKKG